jgi:hypothetical protein
MEQYSAMLKTLLRAKSAVKTKDQKTPPVPPLIKPGVSDLSWFSIGSAASVVVYVR